MSVTPRGVTCVQTVLPLLHDGKMILTWRSQSSCCLLQVLEFLQVAPPEDIGPLLLAGQPHSHTAGQPHMLARTRERLQHFYQPYNQQLADLLSEPKYAEWS